MSKLIEAAVEHFNSKEIRKLEVPEWNTTLYAKNLTLHDKSKMLARADSDNTEFLIFAVILGTCDEQGEPVFSLEDKLALRSKVDPDVVSRVATFVLNSSGDEEEREKNS
jgi:hypothetical protein